MTLSPVTLRNVWKNRWPHDRYQWKEGSMKRIYQCPGCFTVSTLELTDSGYECECCERLTNIDLRGCDLKPDTPAAPNNSRVELEARIEALANEWGRRGLPRNPDILKRILAARTSELRAALGTEDNQ